jgi:hypothetical protein
MNFSNRENLSERLMEIEPMNLSKFPRKKMIIHLNMIVSSKGTLRGKKEK